MKPCGHQSQEPIPGCRVCWLAQNDARYQQMWGLPVTATANNTHQPYHTQALESPICAHRADDPAPMLRVVQLGLNPQRTYYECGKGLGTGGLVCHCGGCGPGCREYAKGSAAQMGEGTG